jgi:ABC-type phosphate transport system substrate-binding protein
MKSFPTGNVVFGGLCAFLLTVWAAAPNPARAATCVSVVAHAENPTTKIEASRLAKMLDKKIKRWDHGVSVTPINLQPDSPVRERFTQMVHGKTISEVEKYWQRMIFSGRDVPPMVRSGDREVLDFVRAEPGAVGYVSCNAVPASGVKVLEVVDPSPASD